MTKPIEDRLLNWARWCLSRSRRPNADSITGLICDRMRKAALGNVWSGHEVRDPVDETDAVRLERAMRKLLKPKRDMLRLYYVRGARWQQICVRVRVRVDRALFDERLRAACGMLEAILQKDN